MLAAKTSTQCPRIARYRETISAIPPALARYGVLGVSTWPIGCDTPSPFSERFPPWRACEVEVRYPPPLKRGISAILARYPMKTRQNACDTPLRDTISKGYCTIWGGGGISHWATKDIKRLWCFALDTLSTHTPLIKGVEVHPLN